MRGSPRSDRPICKCSGIIPAHAGLTFLPSFGLRRHRDHPRACGAHGLMTLNQIADMGSSPRMRGSRKFKVMHGLGDGIIPAHAGLTSRKGGSQPPAGDHPRACGAHQMPSVLDLYMRGSSPRMRGSHHGCAVAGPDAGIIPAHAGLTLYHLSETHQARDHPRACGAHLILY